MRFLREFIATGFYSGFFPVAPGTAGTWVALCLMVAISVFCDVPMWLVGLSGAVLFSLANMLTAGGYAEEINTEDPGCVVIDEFAGMAVTFAAAGASIWSILLAFILFRVFDIVKPYPANRLQDLPGAGGILYDDLVAGAYGAVILLVLRYFVPILN